MNIGNIMTWKFQYMNSGFQVQNPKKEILNPRNTWANKEEYDEKAKDLAKQFIKNFEKYASGASEETASAAPKI